MRARAKFRFLRTFSRDERGSVIIMLTVYLPVIVGFFTLAADMSYVLWSRNMLQATAEAAALAVVTEGLENGLSFANACGVAKSYASKNMPGNVLKQDSADCSDVVLGNWKDTNNCPDSQTGTAKFCAGGTINAVKVTTRLARQNGNPLQLAFASLVGWPTFDVTATAIATYGNDPTAPPFTVSLVQDVSLSFSEEIGSAKEADKALVNCMLNAATGSKLAITVFGLTSRAYQSAVTVADNESTLTNKIDAIVVTSSSNHSTMPSGAGTNIGAGINTAIGQICPNNTCPATSFKPTIVLVSDGLPTAYTDAKGNSVFCGTTNTKCINNNAKPQAETAAQDAANKGIDIYAIYFCNDGSNNCNSATNTDAANWLKTKIVKGDGKFKATPNADEMRKLMSDTVCKSALKVRLVW
ncbi:MAG TPA: TadG family pilus assembly protein [Xanthobacteraceae bacterium]|nr:TadG family pilus assembly protein [Xanthobacteraceae bacterium]